MARGDRRRQILEALAVMLESNPGERITTAALARHVGVSEAALYRHFPSKAKMLEALIEFTEESLFTRVTRVLAEEPGIEQRLRQIIWLILSFAEKNPGFARLMAGDALQGESERLRRRIRQLFDRIETTLRQCIREHQAVPGTPANPPAAATANLLMAYAEGKIGQFVRTEFKAAPTQHWEAQWPLIAGTFAGVPNRSISGS